MSAFLALTYNRDLVSGLACYTAQLGVRKGFLFNRVRQLDKKWLQHLLHWPEVSSEVTVDSFGDMVRISIANLPCTPLHMRHWMQVHEYMYRGPPAIYIFDTWENRVHGSYSSFFCV